MMLDDVHPSPISQITPVVWSDIRQAAYRNGFHKGLTRPRFDQGWYLLRSTLTPFQVHVAACGYQGPWILSYTEPRIDVGALPGTNYVGPMPGHSGRLLGSLGDLSDALASVFTLVTQGLSASAFQEYLEATHDLPATTESERAAIVRTAQGIFRQHLDRYWNQACAITGVPDRELLRASHIKPWATSNDYERLDVHNGLLLSALWDAAFDQGLVSFSDEGRLLVDPKLSERAIAVLTEGRPITVPLNAGHAPYLRDHRLRHGFTALGC